MADPISNTPLGQDSIKGGIFFGSNLTPAGTFSNVPQISSTPPPPAAVEAKLILTLQQVREELQKSAAALAGSTTDVLSDAAVNTFLQSYVQLLIDYSDMRNYVFFGSAYTELTYHINFLIQNYPFKSFFAKNVGATAIDITNQITLTTLGGGSTLVSLEYNDVLQPSNYHFDNSGLTTWVDFDLVDENGTRFPITNAAFTLINYAILAATNTPTINITIPGITSGLQNGDIVNIAGVLGNTNANGTHVIDNVVTGVNTSFDLVGIAGNGVYPGTGGSFDLNRIDLTVTGDVNINNFIEFNPAIGILYKGLLVSPRLETINDFETQLDPIQKELLSATNPTPWPRDLVTDNIIVEGTEFDIWVANPQNMLSGYNVDEMGYVTNGDNLGLSLTSGFTLDDTITNQLLRRAIPHRIVDELRDTDDKFFTRFILLAGKMFDTIKVYIDFLKYTKELNYTQFNQLSPEFYRLYAEHYGFDLFDDENIDLAKAIIRTEPGLSYDNLNNAVYNDSATSRTIKELQNEKQKRLLVNLFYLYSTKGTLKCIETLARLLGAPEGLVVFEEQAFNQTTSQKFTDNFKIKVPQIAYEIDPDFLVDPSNVNNPVNLPYVYRLKLDNENIVNLRELNGYTDPQGAIQQQVIDYGTKVYPYGHFGHRSFANLQNNSSTSALNGYYLLPLTFPDKYCGVTVEYMLPRNGLTKGVGQNLDEASIHLASLYAVEEVTYSGDATDTPGDALDPISLSNRYAYRVPQAFMEGIIGQTDTLNIPYSASFTINTLSGTISDVMTVVVGGSPIGACNWGTTKKATALAITNAINYSQASDDYIAYYKEDIGGTSFTITVESQRQSTPTIIPNELMEVMFNAGLDGDVIGNSQYMINGVGIIDQAEFLIARMEGTDLVCRASLNNETTLYIPQVNRVAMLENVFNADGLNHELRLIYRPEGVEVYQDFKYLGLAPWRDPRAIPSGPRKAYDCPKNEILSAPISSLPKIFAYPDDETTTSLLDVPATGTLDINELSGTVNNIQVYVDGNPLLSIPISGPVSIATLVASIVVGINLDTAITGILATSTGNVITIIEDTTFGQPRNGNVITMTMDTAAGTLNYTSYNMDGGHSPFEGDNSGLDTPTWWDLFVGLPVNVNMLFKRVAVQEMPSVNHPDTLDFGIDVSGQEVEKFSFNFANQLQDINGNYILDQISVPCEYKSPSPFPANALAEPDTVDLTFTSYSSGIVTDLRLVNQTYLRGGEARFTQDVQNYFKLPSGETITIDSLFKFNGWSQTLHKDYTYENFNEVYNNYQIFSEQVLTYLTLLPFMELVEDKFKKLISQFIPIVINIANFGRLVRALEAQKVHYPNIHKICSGNIDGCLARGSFRIVHGSNNGYLNLNNNLTVKIQITKFISNASNTSPIVITTTAQHNFTAGNTIDIAGVIGNAAANGSWTISNLTPFTFELDTSVGSGAYTGGGSATETPITFGTTDWYGSNSLTAADVANTILAYGPTYVPSSNFNSVVIDVDPGPFAFSHNHDINDCDLVVTTNSNVQVDAIHGFDGGYASIKTGGCFTITVTNNVAVEPGFEHEFIYYNAELGLWTYIYYESEIVGPGPYLYI